MTGSGGIHRKHPLAMGDVVQMFIKEMKISAGLNTRRIFAAWDQASGAAQYTIRRYFRDGKLTITLNSSMVRSQLFLSRELLVSKINMILDDDPLFVKDDPRVKKVKEIVLK